MRSPLSLATLLLLSACSRHVAMIEACAPAVTRDLEFEIVSLDRTESTLSGGQVTYTLKKTPDGGARFENRYLSGCRVKSLSSKATFAAR